MEEIMISTLSYSCYDITITSHYFTKGEEVIKIKKESLELTN